MILRYTLAAMLLAAPALAQTGNLSGGSVRATGGTTFRTLADRAADWINLKDFGTAVGDGSDATAAIVAAMAVATSKTIYIPAGTYGLTTGTRTASSAVSLVGQGAGKSIIRMPASCTQTGDILVWVARSNVTIQDLTLDLNGCTASGISGGLSVAGGANLTINRVSIINAGSGPWLQISLNGVTAAQVTNSYIHRTAAATTQNQAINVSSSYAAADNLLISGNTLVNSGTLVNATHLRYIGNSVSGWAYGAGISTHPTQSANATIADNVFYDSGVAVDADGAWPNGIESWGPHAVITGNRVSNVAAGLFVSGPNSLLSGNTVYAAGKRNDAAGAASYTLNYTDASRNAIGTTMVGNVALDDGSGLAKYGLWTSVGVTSAYAPLIANYFTGATAATLLNGSGVNVGGLGPITLVGASPNYGVSLGLTGTGALMTGTHDGSATGGSAPGTNAVDLCTTRSVASAVASGVSSLCAYGANNTANGTYSMAGGNWSTAQGTGSVVLGQFGVDRYRSSSIFASGQNATAGDSQAGTHVLRGITTSTSPTRLTNTNSAATTNNCVNLPNINFSANQQSVYGVSIRVVATNRTTVGNFTHYYEPAGTLSRSTNIASTAYLASGAAATYTVGAGGTIAVSADTTNACLNITWTAPNTNTWHVVARVDSVEAY